MTSDKIETIYGYRGGCTLWQGQLPIQTLKKPLIGTQFPNPDDLKSAWEEAATGESNRCGSMEEEEDTSFKNPGKKRPRMFPAFNLFHVLNPK